MRGIAANIGMSGRGRLRRRSIDASSRSSMCVDNDDEVRKAMFKRNFCASPQREIFCPLFSRVPITLEINLE